MAIPLESGASTELETATSGLERRVYSLENSLATSSRQLLALERKVIKLETETARLPSQLVSLDGGTKLLSKSTKDPVVSHVTQPSRSSAVAGPKADSSDMESTRPTESVPASDIVSNPISVQDKVAINENEEIATIHLRAVESELSSLERQSTALAHQAASLLDELAVSKCGSPTGEVVVRRSKGLQRKVSSHQNRTHLLWTRLSGLLRSPPASEIVALLWKTAALKNKNPALVSQVATVNKKVANISSQSESSDDSPDVLSQHKMRSSTGQTTSELETDALSGSGLDTLGNQLVVQEKKVSTPFPLRKISGANRVRYYMHVPPTISSTPTKARAPGYRPLVSYHIPRHTGRLIIRRL